MIAFRFYPVGIISAILIGAVLAVMSRPGVQASGWHWEAVDTHWHAGVWQWTNTAWWCFGLLGWHGDQYSGSGRAADVFADAYDPSCYGPSSTEVRFHVSGYIGSTPSLGAIAAPIVDQMQSGPDRCNILRVRLYDYRIASYRGVLPLSRLL
jgi:hypothetical protein